jgi:hypothetical protein
MEEVSTTETRWRVTEQFDSVLTLWTYIREAFRSNFWRIHVFITLSLTVAARSKSSPARTLESWVRSTLEASLPVCSFILCSCCPVCRYGLATGWSPIQGFIATLYRITRQMRPVPNGYRDIDEWMNEWMNIWCPDKFHPSFSSLAPSKFSDTATVRPRPLPF